MTNQEQIDQIIAKVNAQIAAEIIAKVNAQIAADEVHAKQFTFTKFNHGAHVSCGHSFKRKGVEAKVDGSFNGVAFSVVRFTKVSKGWEVSLLPKGDYYFEAGHGCFSTLKEAKRHALKNSGAA